MASGTPVITSNVSSLPEVVGDAALLIDPYDPAAIADAMRRVLTEPALREDLRQRGLAARARVLVGALGPARARDLRRGDGGVSEIRLAGARDSETRDPGRWFVATSPSPESRVRRVRLRPPSVRHRPRLADRDARRREGARGDLRALPRRHAPHARPRARLGVSADRAAPRRSRPPCSGCPTPGACTATTFRCFRRRSSSSTSTVTIS